MDLHVLRITIETSLRESKQRRESQAHIRRVGSLEKEETLSWLCPCNDQWDSVKPKLDPSRICRIPGEEVQHLDHHEVRTEAPEP